MPPRLLVSPLPLMSDPNPGPTQETQPDRQPWERELLTVPVHHWPTQNKRSMIRCLEKKWRLTCIYLHILYYKLGSFSHIHINIYVYFCIYLFFKKMYLRHILVTFLTKLLHCMNPPVGRHFVWLLQTCVEISSDQEKL